MSNNEQTLNHELIGTKREPVSSTRGRQIWRHAEVHLTQKHKTDGPAYRLSCTRPQLGAE